MVKRFKDDVQLVLYPYALNSRSFVATQLALCAGEQDQFWEAHSMLYKRQASWSRLNKPLSRLIELSAGLELDTEVLEQCIESGRMKSLVEADRDYGKSLQVRSTPTVFINTRRIIGSQSEADFVRTIRQELARAKRRQQ